jgi:hypothetical protein
MRGELPRAARQLNGVYAQRFNRRHRRCGHVFEGRYRCLLVDREAYLLELARYIVLNPVRAGLTESPAAWPWSSYRATAGLDPVPRFLSVDFIRRASGGRAGEYGAADFQRWVSAAADAGRDAELDVIVDQAVVSGGRPFIQSAAQGLQGLEISGEVPVAHRRAGRPALAELLGGCSSDPARDARIRAAVIHHGYTQVEVGQLLRLSRSTISRAVRGERRVGRAFPES